jgi:hypothetical protein
MRKQKAADVFTLTAPAYCPAYRLIKRFVELPPNPSIGKTDWYWPFDNRSRLASPSFPD